MGVEFREAEFHVSFDADAVSVRIEFDRLGVFQHFARLWTHPTTDIAEGRGRLICIEKRSWGSMGGHQRENCVGVKLRL